MELFKNKHSKKISILIFIGVVIFIFVINNTEDNYYNYQEYNFSNSNSFIEKQSIIDDNFSHNTEIHWTHMPITYYIENEEECGWREVREIKTAFRKIMEVTGEVVMFEKIESSADININCSFIKNCYDIEIEKLGEYYYLYTESICEHDLGLAEITNYSGNKILNAHIELIGLWGFKETKEMNSYGESGFTVGDCQLGITELHEILHTFGYGHSDDPSSVMYYAGDFYGGVNTHDCSNRLELKVDQEIIDDLIYIYG